MYDMAGRWTREPDMATNLGGGNPGSAPRGTGGVQSGRRHYHRRHLTNQLVLTKIPWCDTVSINFIDSASVSQSSLNNWSAGSAAAWLYSLSSPGLSQRYLSGPGRRRGARSDLWGTLCRHLEPAR